MRYFLDSEFSDDGSSIALLSIALVAEDGREYYGQCGNWNEHDIDPWVLKHVVPQLDKCPEHGAWWHQEFRNGGSCGAEGCPWHTTDYHAVQIRGFIGDDKPEIWGYYAGGNVRSCGNW